MSSILLTSLVSILFLYLHLVKAKYVNIEDVLAFNKLSLPKMPCKSNKHFTDHYFIKMREKNAEQVQGKSAEVEMYIKSKIGNNYNFQFVYGARKYGKCINVM